MKIIQNIKNLKKSVLVASTSLVSVVTSASYAFADTVTNEIDVANYTGAFQTCVTNFIAIMAALAPIGLSVFIAKYCWVEGSKFFSRLSKAK